MRVLTPRAGMRRGGESICNPNGVPNEPSHSHHQEKFNAKSIGVDTLPNCPSKVAEQLHILNQSEDGTQ